MYGTSAAEGDAVRLVRYAILVCFTFVTSAVAVAQSPSTNIGETRLTLDAAIREALEKNVDLIAARAGVSIADANLTQARDVRAIIEYAYRRGRATLIEFLDAQRAFNETMQAWNEARAEYARSVFLVRAAVGEGGGP